MTTKSPSPFPANGLRSLSDAEKWQRNSARINDDYPGNVKEVMYPGAHSDVGGG